MIMIYNYSVSNYKIHKEAYQYDFKGLNVFTGANNSGKTSLVQSIRNIFPWIDNKQGYNYLPIEQIDASYKIQDVLNKELSRGAHIVYDFAVAESENDAKEWIHIEFASTSEMFFAPLDRMDIALMTEMQLEYKDKKYKLKIDEQQIQMSVYKVFRCMDDSFEECDFKITFGGMQALFFGNIQVRDNSIDDVKFLLDHLHSCIKNDKITYMAPFRISEPIANASIGGLLNSSGCNSAEILERNKFSISYDGKRNLMEAFNYWTKRIMGVEVQTRIIGNSIYFVEIENGIALRLNQTGLGISQLIPIIVSVITRKKGDLLIIENPEVHLHPKWKTELVDLFYDAVENGVQIILETQSIEIVNRIRRRSKENDKYRKNTQIWFFEKRGFSCEVNELEIQEDGGLSYWPNDFVDQITLDDSMALL